MTVRAVRASNGARDWPRVLVKWQVKLITCSGAVTADGSVGEAPDEPR